MLACLLISACDPGVSAEYLVSTASDDSTAQQSQAIALGLSYRHGMTSPGLSESCDLASYEKDLGGGTTHVLTLCVDDGGQRVSFRIGEFIASHWSSQGDSLRHELEDTLRARFGDRVTSSH